jgi:hypothetical protein
MIPTLLAASAVYGMLTVSAIVFGRDQLGGQSHLWLSVVLSSFVAPALATWFVAEGLHVLSPRRLLQRNLKMPIRRMALGGLAGVLGCILGVLGMAGLDRYGVPDAAITAAGAAIATLLVIVPTTRIRKGECLHCRYSFAGATPASKGVCAECGSDLMAA